MKDKVFIDTNLLIYSMDSRSKAKQKLARNLLKDIYIQGAGVISTQVLEEFYVASTKKLKMNPSIVREIISFFDKFEVVHISTELIREAIDVNILNKISFWDALIIVSAEFAKCSILLTEDLNAGQTIKGVQIVNPFSTV